jgi:hypothetical protein
METPRMNVSDMYIDYAMCMSRREMERKYNLSYSTISRRCKQITERLFKDNHSILSKQVDEIKKEVDRIAADACACPHCKQANFFWMDKE